MEDFQNVPHPLGLHKEKVIMNLKRCKSQGIRAGTVLRPP